MILKVPDGQILEVVDAYRSFGAVHALAGVNIEIRQGELLGVVGPNGSGKTTLFNCITGRYRLNRGRVLWQGTDVTRWPMHRIARAGLVRTFQQSMAFGSATVRGNVQMAIDIARTGHRADRHIEVPRDVDAMLAFTDLGDLADSPSSVLSHGSLRRLGIALALSARPSLLLLDEPAAGLNDAESQELARLLKRVRKTGVTLAVVDHDMGFLMPLVDRMIVLATGRILKDATPDVVRRDPAVVEAYLGTGFGKHRSRGESLG